MKLLLKYYNGKDGHSNACEPNGKGSNDNHNDGSNMKKVGKHNSKDSYSNGSKNKSGDAKILITHQEHNKKDSKEKRKKKQRKINKTNKNKSKKGKKNKSISSSDRWGVHPKDVLKFW